MKRTKPTPGSLIRDRRQGLYLNLSTLANLIGCSDSHLSDIEHNKRRPSEKLTRRLANALGVEFEYLCLVFGRVPPKIRVSLMSGDFSAFAEMEKRIGTISA